MFLSSWHSIPAALFLDITFTDSTPPKFSAASHHASKLFRCRAMSDSVFGRLHVTLAAFSSRTVFCLLAVEFSHLNLLQGDIIGKLYFFRLLCSSSKLAGLLCTTFHPLSAEHRSFCSQEYPARDHRGVQEFQI